MSGSVFFKVGWDAINVHLADDCIAAFEPEAGLPNVKSMLAQTQGGASSAVNARRWCIHTLYAALKRIEDLEAMACCKDAGDPGGSQPRVKVLEDALEQHKTLLRTHTRFMEMVNRAARAVEPESAQGGEYCGDQVVRLLNEVLPNRLRIKGLEDTLKRRDAELEDLRSRKDIAPDQEVTRLKAMIESKDKEIWRLHQDMDSILLAAVKQLYPEGLPKGTTVGVPEVTSLFSRTGDAVANQTIQNLKSMVKNVETRSKVYYTGWKTKAAHLSEAGLSRLQEELARLADRNVTLPVLAPGGRVTEEETVGAIVELMGRVMPEGAPAVTPNPAPAPPLAITELQNKLDAVARSRDSFIKEFEQIWDRVPVDLRGDKSSLLDAVIQMGLRLQDLERTQMLMLSALPEQLQDQINPTDGQEALGWVGVITSLVRAASQNDLLQTIHRAWEHVPLPLRCSDRDGYTLDVAVKNMAERISKRSEDREALQEAKDRIEHLTMTVSDLTMALAEAKPAHGGSIRVADHTLWVNGYMVDGKIGQLPSYIDITSTERAPVASLGDPEGIPAPLTSRYIREDLGAISQIVSQAKADAFAASEVREETPQEAILRVVTTMVTKALDQDSNPNPTGRLSLNWVPEKGVNCVKGYDGHESAVISNVETITPTFAGTPQEGTGYAMDVNHLTVMLAWNGTHPSQWGKGIVPMATHSTI